MVDLEWFRPLRRPFALPRSWLERLALVGSEVVALGLAVQALMLELVALALVDLVVVDLALVDPPHPFDLVPLYFSLKIICLCLYYNTGFEFLWKKICDYGRMVVLRR